MTMQTRDGFELEDEHFNIWLGQGTGFFDADEAGIMTAYGSTACWRGFYATYRLYEERLELHKLIVSRDLEATPSFHGREPHRFTDPGDPISGVGYADIGIRVPFSGGLVLQRKRAVGLQVIGSDLTWAFADVRELIFNEGKLVEAHDHSPAMAKLRERFLQQQNATSLQSTWGLYGEMERAINDCLALDYL